MYAAADAPPGGNPCSSWRKTTALPSAAEALPGRDTPIPTATTHFVNGASCSRLIRRL